MPDLPAAFQLLLMLAMGHFVGDFGLQSDRMAREKCPGNDVTLSWGWWLSSHAAIHGFLVAAVSGCPWLGAAEWGMHMLIDFGKCRQRWGLTTDQALHLACKLVWTLILLQQDAIPAWIR
ncbi:MAG: DUF3307 domain-containing protein [Synechococcaceae cyanobacterium]|nr:DUF3307 domain-containing protein [Synechococcaceae cyanobacterium]